VKFEQRSSVDANVPYWEAEEVKEDEQPTLDGSVLSMNASLEGREGKMPQSLDDLERDMIRRALDVNNGRRKAAAEQLGISERTLYRKIKEYGLE
jgi:DNA-binding NtrC family response regulator